MFEVEIVLLHAFGPKEMRERAHPPNTIPIWGTAAMQSLFLLLNHHLMGGGFFMPIFRERRGHYAENVPI